jgi:hypothetical protein
MSLKNDYVLPSGEPESYLGLTDDQLQQEINYCLDALSIFRDGFILINSKNVSYYKFRMKLAEDELERRFLLS